MSADRLLFPPPASCFPPGPAEGFGDSDPHGGPEMETLRMFVNERLTAAVDEILGAFGKTVARYREQIDRQRRQLDSLRSAEEEERSRAADPLPAASWIRTCPEQRILSVRLVQADETDAATSPAQIKKESSSEDCGGSEPHRHFDPEAAIDGRLPANASDTEESEQYWRDAARRWKPDEKVETEGQKSDREARNSTAPSQELPPVFSCRVCGESFQRMSHLLTHTPSHPSDCGVCGQHLERSENLKLHLKVHRENSFRCSVCGQTFTLRGNLRMHMRIHSGERPYGCTVCGKSFGRRATLVRHVRSHTGEKPFTCTYCGRGFVEKGNLTVHLRTHTGERPYWCSICDRRFSQLSCFYKHPCVRKGETSVSEKPD